jgi:hypothetical protein
MRFRRFLFGVLLAAELAGFVTPVLAQPTQYRGRSVQSVIDELRSAGVPLVYSTNLLPDTLVVAAEPNSGEPLALAREILAPHGLTLRESGGSWLVVRAEVAPANGAITVTAVSASTGEPVAASVALDAGAGTAELTAVLPGRHVVTVRAPGYLPERLSVEVEAGATATVRVALFDVVPKLEEITVTASRYDVIDAVRPSATAFTRDDIESLAELGDDTVRVAHRLPGIAASEFSARSHVRGGAADEMMVLLAGVELVEPYHLRDYQGVFSAIDQRIVSGLQIYSGGYPAEYGDALSGLMVIEPREPTELAHELGVSLLHTSVLSSGTFADGRGTWLGSARRSNLGDVLNNDVGEPSYHDAFARVGLAIGSKHRLTFNSLGYDDDIVLEPKANGLEQETARVEVDSQQFWLSFDSDWTASLSSRLWLFSTKFDSLRRETVSDAELDATVVDWREQDSVGLKQEWRLELADRQLLAFGVDAERFDAHFDYASTAAWRGVLASIAPAMPAQRAFELLPAAHKYSAFVSDRVRFTERVVAELGLRWDRQSYSPGEANSQTSPRASLLFMVAPRTDVRVSYGRFFQSEQPVDLPVEDGVTAFAHAQDASHSIVSVEHRFDGDLVLRVEAFRKWTHGVRPRYENLFDPIVLVPELRPGRVLVAPDRAESHGIEVLLNGGEATPWWLGYSVSRVDDIFAGVHVPRSWDQRYALDAGVSREIGRWSFSAAASVHSGWPATAVTLEQSGGQTVAVLGPRNADRLRPLRRIDFRASRNLDVGVGALRLFAEITNVTNRNNPCCLRYEEGAGAGGTPTLLRSERFGLPLTGNIGLLWEF